MDISACFSPLRWRTCPNFATAVIACGFSVFSFISVNSIQLFGSTLCLGKNLTTSDFSSSYQIAKREMSNGCFQESIRLFKNCILIAKNDDNSKLDCLTNLGVLYWDIGDLKTSKGYYSDAANLAKSLGQKNCENFSLSALKIHDLYQEGKAYRSTEEFQKSIKAFNRAISLSREIQSPEFELKCLRLLSLTYWEISDFTQFYQLSLAALNLAERLNHNKEKGRCLNNIAAYYGRFDQYSLALGTYEKALKIAKEENIQEDIAIALLNIGGIWSDLGNYERSLEYLKQALEIDKKLEDKSSIAKDLNNIGIAMRLKGLSDERKGDLIEAETTFRLSLDYAKETGDQSIEAQVLNNIGSIYADLDRHRDALKYFKLAASIAERASDSSYLGMVYNNIGIMYSNLGNSEESTAYYDKALKLASKYKDSTFVWETLYELGNARKKQADYMGALQDYRNAVTAIEEIRSKITHEELKATYLGTDKRIEAFQKLIDLLVTLQRMKPKEGYGKEAFNYLERSKARAFLDSFEVAEIDVSQRINPNLLNREKELMRDISRANKELLVAGLTFANKERIAEQIKSSEDQLEALKREIRMSSPAYADLKYPKVITYDEVREGLLSSEEAYFAYSIGKESSNAFVISHKGLKIFSLPSRKILQQQIIAFRKALVDRQNRDFKLGRELFQELVSPGLEPGLKKLIFVPDDILNLLPFETLLTNLESNSWLIRDYIVGYVPSLSSLRVLKQRRQSGSTPRRDLLVVGNTTYGAEAGKIGKSQDSAVLYDLSSSTEIPILPLKYSAFEIQNISRLFPQKKIKVLEKENATERWLKSNPLNEYKILHFAAHSVIDDKKPMRSAIVLSFNNKQAEDGLLQTRDIYNLKLNADLVTLSACQTGLGQFVRGEGMEGLSRAFFYAGSSSVLMSLWAINDQATYLLMERFYRHLKSADSLMGALRNAKLEMIHTGTLSHPYYWAGFIINGKTDTIVFSKSRVLLELSVSSFGVGMLLILAAVIHRHKKPLSGAKRSPSNELISSIPR
jgi:CHAT domain-containing protein/tetratricopeptide (TPR) repeat protein